MRTGVLLDRDNYFTVWCDRISGIVALAINVMPSTQLWVLLNTIKFALAVRR